VNLGGGPIGTLDVYAVDPREWDETRSECFAGLCRGGGQPAWGGDQGRAQRGLAQQLQVVALESRGWIEQAKGTLMERERLDNQEAFTHLRRAGRSSGRKLTEVAREVAAGKFLPRRRPRLTPTQSEQPKGEPDTT
jgi:hypothetical protein